MSKPALSELEKAAVASREAAFEEMWQHMLGVTRMFGRSIFAEESAAGAKMNAALREKHDELKKRVLS